MLNHAKTLIWKKPAFHPVVRIVFSSVYLYSVVQCVGWGALVEQCTERMPSFYNRAWRDGIDVTDSVSLFPTKTIEFPAIVLNFFTPLLACFPWFKVCLDGEWHSCSLYLCYVNDFCFLAYTSVRWHHAVAYNIWLWLGSTNVGPFCIVIIRHAEPKKQKQTQSSVSGIFSPL